MTIILTEFHRNIRLLCPGNNFVPEGNLLLFGIGNGLLRNIAKKMQNNQKFTGKIGF